MKVLKFGGTSVANAENIRKVMSIVQDTPSPVVVVVSALGGVTDNLLLDANKAATHQNNYMQLLEELQTTKLDTVR